MNSCLAISFMDVLHFLCFVARRVLFSVCFSLAKTHYCLYTMNVNKHNCLPPCSPQVCSVCFLALLPGYEPCNTIVRHNNLRPCASFRNSAFIYSSNSDSCCFVRFSEGLFYLSIYSVKRCHTNTVVLLWFHLTVLHSHLPIRLTQMCDAPTHDGQQIFCC